MLASTPDANQHRWCRPRGGAVTPANATAYSAVGGPKPVDRIAGKADLIVSGDKKHMLALGAVEGIPIVAAREAVDRLGNA